MKPAPFNYCCPETIDEAVSMLAHASDAKVMAGGQSLIPMMNFRVVKPSLVVDISKLIELDFVRVRQDGGLSVGALTKHRTFETSEVVLTKFPVISEAMKHVAHLAIRNKGTIGGSLSHADPAAEWPMLVLLFDAVIILYSLRGEREVAAKEFFLGALTTVLAEDEIVIRVEFPGSTQEMSGAFHEVSRRPGDFAMAAAGVLLSACDGVVTSSKVALMGVSETPIRSDIAESLLTGSRLTLEKIKSISNEVSESLTPRTDLHASLDYRKHLASVVLERAISSAWDDAINSKNSRTMT